MLTILDEIEKINDHVNFIVDTEDFSLNEKLFLAILYTHKLSQLEKEMKDIEKQVDE